MREIVAHSVVRRPWRHLLPLAVLALVPTLAVAQASEAEQRVATAIADFDGALERFDFEALRGLLAPEFTELSKGCGPDKPRSSRAQYLSTLAAASKTNPTLRRQRGPLEIKLLGNGDIAVARSQVTDTMEWPTGTLTANSHEAIFLTRTGSGYKLTSLDATLACADMHLTGSLPPPPGP